MKIGKKAIALVLALSMVVGTFVSTAAFAAIDPEQTFDSCYVDGSGEVGHFASLAAALEKVNDSGVVYLNRDTSVEETVEITKPVTINGLHHTISVSKDISGNTNGSGNTSVLQPLNAYDVTITDLTVDGSLNAKHGINIFESENVILDGVAVENCKGAGVTVNSSTAILQNTITLTNNAWGGINVSKGSDPSDPDFEPHLTLSDGAEIKFTAAAGSMGTTAIWVDFPLDTDDDTMTDTAESYLTLGDNWSSRIVDTADNRLVQYVLSPWYTEDDAGRYFYPTLQDAIDDAAAYSTIYLAENTSIDATAVIDKPVTIDGQGNTLSMSGNIVPNPNGSNSVLQPQSTKDVTITGLTIDGTNAKHGINIFESRNVTLDSVAISDCNGAGVIVNSSTAILQNMITLTNNAWGGINVSKGSNPSPKAPKPKLTLDNSAAIHFSSTNPDTVAIWVDFPYLEPDTDAKAISEANSYLSLGDNWAPSVKMDGMKHLVQYVVSPWYTQSGEKKTFYPSLQAAIGKVATNGTIYLNSDATIDATANITKPITIDGQGNTLSVSTDISGNPNGSNSVLQPLSAKNIIIRGLTIDGSNAKHGINIFESTNVNLVGVTIKNCNGAGVIVDSSTAALLGTITLTDNAWGGVNVSKGSSPSPKAPKPYLTAAGAKIDYSSQTSPLAIWADFPYQQPTSAAAAIAEANSYVDLGDNWAPSVAQDNDSNYFVQYVVSQWYTENDGGSRIFYPSLQNAIDTADAGSTIYLDSDAEIDATANITKPLTIDGNMHTLSVSTDISVNTNGSGNTCVLQPNGTENVTIRNLTINGSNAKHGINIFESRNVNIEDVIIENCNGAGVIVDSSTATLLGTITLTDNAWGGVNVSKGSSPSQDAPTPQLTLDSKATINYSSTTSPLAIWVDFPYQQPSSAADAISEANSYVDLGDNWAPSVITNNNKYYVPYVVSPWYTLNGEKKTFYPTLQNAIDTVTAGNTIYLNLDAAIDATVNITKPVTIDGQGHTLSVSKDISGNSNGSGNNSVLKPSSTKDVTIKALTIDGSNAKHGINIIESTNVHIDGVTIANCNGAGIIVNSSTAVLLGTITLTDNKWGGINISEGSSPSSNAPGPQLTFGDSASLVCTPTSGTQHAIWIDLPQNGDPQKVMASYLPNAEEFGWMGAVIGTQVLYEYVPGMIVTSFTALNSKAVLYGTSLDDLALPTAIVGNAVSGSTSVSVVNWSSVPSYDGTKAGDYTFTPQLTDGYLLTKDAKLPTIKVTVGQKPAVTGITANPSALPTNGGNSTVTVTGTNLQNGIVVTGYIGDVATAVTGKTTGTQTVQSVTLTFPENTSSSMGQSYTIKASTDNGTTWSNSTAAVAVSKKNHSDTSTPSTPSAPSTTVPPTTVTNPQGGTTTTVTTQPESAPTVTDNRSSVTVAVPSEAASAIASASAENPAQLTITTPTSTITEQLRNSNVSTVDLTIQVPPAVANNTNANARVAINVEPSVLQAAKDEQKDVTLNVTDSQTGAVAYSWSFSGEDLRNSAAPVNNVNLAISVESVQSDAATAAIAASNSSGQQPAGLVLRFGDNGLLPAPATVRVYVGNQSGITANSSVFLYYFNSTTNTLEPLSQSEYTVDANGYVTFTISHCSNYVLLPKAATNSYPVTSDTTYTVGVKNGKTYTFAMTVKGNVVPTFTVGNEKAFTGTVQHKGNKYYYTVKAIGTTGTMTAVYCTLPKQKPVAMCYIVVAK